MTKETDQRNGDDVAKWLARALGAGWRRRIYGTVSGPEETEIYVTWEAMRGVSNPGLWRLTGLLPDTLTRNPFIKVPAVLDAPAVREAVKRRLLPKYLPMLATALAEERTRQKRDRIIAQTERAVARLLGEKGVQIGQHVVGRLAVAYREPPDVDKNPDAVTVELIGKVEDFEFLFPKAFFNGRTMRLAVLARPNELRELFAEIRRAGRPTPRVTAAKEKSR